MEDYPKNLTEFEQRFSSDEACVLYLEKLRWPDGFCCPRCGSEKNWRTKRGLLVCASCQYHASVTAGTIFERSRKPLSMWFRAMWYVTSQKTGASALGLQRILGLGSYRTAWTWLHKLRRAMVRPGRERLSGHVEVDETYVGGEEKGKRGRPTAGEGTKAMVVIAAEKDGKGFGRIRMRRVKAGTATNLQSFIQDVVEPGSVINTDAWQGYAGLDSKRYQHEITSMKNGSESLPRVHRVASLLKRWLQGTHQGAVSHAHLDYYLDEFTFRFNRRTSRSRGKLFYRLVQQAAAVDPIPYKSMIRHVRGPKGQTTTSSGRLS